MGDDLAIRAFRPDARKIEIVTNGSASGTVTADAPSNVEAEKIHRDGFFQAKVPNATRDLDYRLQITNWDGSEYAMRDPYQYGPIMGEMDLHLFGEGQNWCLYEKFGAHLREINGERGCYFAVWAPNAQRVSVVGDFNGWDGRVNPMRKHPGAGVWELFLPGVREGAHYKFEIRTPAGAVLLEERSVRVFQSVRENRLRRWFTISNVTNGRRRVDGSAPDKGLAEVGDVDLRSPSRFLAAKNGRGKSPPQLSRARRHSDSVCASRWVTPTSS